MLPRPGNIHTQTPTSPATQTPTSPATHTQTSTENLTRRKFNFYKVLIPPPPPKRKKNPVNLPASYNEAMVRARHDLRYNIIQISQ